MIIGFAGCNGEGVVPAPTSIHHLLRVQGSGGGSGTVTAPDASPQLACNVTRGAVSGVCAGGYPSTSFVYLTATPNAGSTFAGWSGGGCTGPDQCAVEMSKEQTVTAAFAVGQAMTTP